mmetsp:Transcript_12871/g.47064  ORF Transcript_12871/g.47064 Transcript_12871/m.47064 type:complete len:237 (-) Transcript_12871:141-851(-)
MTDPARENEEEGDNEQPDEEEMATVASSEPPAGSSSRSLSRSVLAVGLGAAAGMGMVYSAGLSAAALVPYAMSSLSPVIPGVGTVHASAAAWGVAANLQAASVSLMSASSMITGGAIGAAGTAVMSRFRRARSFFSSAEPAELQPRVTDASFELCSLGEDSASSEEYPCVMCGHRTHYHCVRCTASRPSSSRAAIPPYVYLCPPVVDGRSTLCLDRHCAGLEPKPPGQEYWPRYEE